VPFLRALFLLVALVLTARTTPTLAEDPASAGPNIVAGVKDAANQIALYLDFTARTGQRPDFSHPPVSDLLARVLDFQGLAALPPASATDISWLPGWTAAASQVSRGILYFGISPPVDPAADKDAIKRNMTDFEDQEASALAFMIRITARQAETMYLFMLQLTPEQRTPVRQDGFNKARGGAAEVVYGALVTIVQGLKVDNARRIAAAVNDTRDIWVGDVLPKDRPPILDIAAKAEAAVKDAETRKNLASFRAALAAAKDPPK
jgi:hypothetical protein